MGERNRLPTILDCHTVISVIHAKNMVFLFPFDSFVITSECNIFPLWEQLILLYRDEICFSVSVSMKCCQSLLPLPSVSQLATSAPITAAHGQPLWASAALNLASLACPHRIKIRLDGRMRVQFVCHTCLQVVWLICVGNGKFPSQILTAFKKIKKNKSLPSSLGLCGKRHSTPMQKSNTSFWSYHKVLTVKNPYKCVPIGCNYGVTFFYRCQLSFSTIR